MDIRHRGDLWQLVDGITGNAAEIGVAEGFFSAKILAWPVNFPTVYLVDRWLCVPDQKGDAANPQEWHEANLAGVLKRTAEFGDRAVLLRGSSDAMAKQVPNRTLALVYIDADHSYEGALSDIMSWRSKLVPGGVMAFHDYDTPNPTGVKQAVVEYFFGRNEIHLLLEDKPEDRGAWVRC